MPEFSSVDKGKEDLGLGNPYNPYGLNTEFKVNILDDGKFLEMRDELKKESQAKKIPLDNEMIVFEGCERDDKIILGGKNSFLSHFCTFFNFSICSAPHDQKMIQRNIFEFQMRPRGISGRQRRCRKQPKGAPVWSELWLVLTGWGLDWARLDWRDCLCRAGLGVACGWPA